MRRRLEGITIGAFVVGAAVMLIFDGLIARLVGVAGLATFIVCGLFLIADPAYLKGDEPE
jgi:hypothetical protein